MRFFFGRIDRIVCVSRGVAEDISGITGIPMEEIAVVANPVGTRDLYRFSEEAVEHPWPGDRQVPVIVGIGRLTEQKDFTTLLRAFAKVREQRKCRLIILGEGRKRTELENLISSLDIDQDVSLPGFVANPYSYLSRCSLFVLSSKWEGSPNVLTEALALGVPVVSTDCPSGPREILEGGKYGYLVSPGDDDALAEAMLRTLDNPLPVNILKEAVSRYTVEESVSGYLKAMGMADS
jgi:glycosyltransferase involved in cell wall biosynthesis